MAEKTTTIVASVAQNHPSGQRVRAGHLFTTEPQEYEVTAKELEEIKADAYIRIAKGGKDVAPSKTDEELAAEKVEADRIAKEKSDKEASDKEAADKEAADKVEADKKAQKDADDKKAAETDKGAK